MSSGQSFIPAKSPFKIPDFRFKLTPSDSAPNYSSNRSEGFDTGGDPIESQPSGDGSESVRNGRLRPIPWRGALDHEYQKLASNGAEGVDDGNLKTTDLDMDEDGDDHVPEYNSNGHGEEETAISSLIRSNKGEDGQVDPDFDYDTNNIIMASSGQSLAQSEIDFFNLYPSKTQKIDTDSEGEDQTREDHLPEGGEAPFSDLHSKISGKRVRRGDYACGLGPFYPAFLQRFANIKAFAVHYALAVLTILMFHTSFIGSVTGIEKRFRFPSQKSGFLMSINDIGHVPFVIIASFYLGRSRKPLFLGLGTLLFSVGVAFMTLPYFIFGPSQITDRVGPDNSTETGISLCRYSQGATSHKSSCDAVDYNRVSYALMCVGEVILGIGGSWIGPLGMAYIDDNVKKAKTVPLYMATVSCVRSLGPVFGFLLSALCSSIHETLRNPGLDKRDPRWIGAWWLGFCIIIVLQIITAIPLMFYPKHMRLKRGTLKEPEGTPKASPDAKNRENLLTKNRPNPNIKAVPQEKPKITNILGAVFNLIKNPVYIITTIGECISIYSIVGYMIFLPKFMESQFSISASYANAITGALGVFSSSAGIIIGGYMMKRYNIKLRGALLIAITGLMITAVKAITLMNLRCEPTNLAGHLSFSGTWNISQTCNRNCQCDRNYFEPVCGNGNQVLYLNPCLAGCQNYVTNADNKIKAYTHCSCLGSYKGGINNTMSGIMDQFNHPTSAVPGLCNRNCRNFIPYLVIMALGSFLAAPAIVAITMVKLRCVSVEEKPFALGFSSFLMSILAFLPGPLITGTLIDKTCLVWKQGSCDTSGSCLFYDTDRLRFVIHGILTLSKILATLLYVIAWWFSKDEKYVELEKIHYKD